MGYTYNTINILHSPYNWSEPALLILYDLRTQHLNLKSQDLGLAFTNFSSSRWFLWKKCHSASTTSTLVNLTPVVLYIFQISNYRTQSNTWLWDDDLEELNKISRRFDHLTGLKVANPFIKFDQPKMNHSELVTSEAWQVS